MKAKELKKRIEEMNALLRVMEARYEEMKRDHEILNRALEEIRRENEVLRGGKDGRERTEGEAS